MNSVRLGAIDELSQRQFGTLMALHQAEGLCACGRPIMGKDPRYVLVSAFTEHPQNPKMKGCMSMFAYCFACFRNIDAMLKALRGTYVAIEK